MKVTKAEQKAKTRERLLDAAIAVFAREGYPNATVDMIAKEAGTSRPTFYSNFKDKDEISFMLTERLTSNIERVFEELDLLEWPSEQEVLLWLKKLRKLWKSERQVLEAISSTLVSTDEASQNYIKLLRLHSERCMPRHLASLSDVKKKEFITTFILLRLQMERYFFVTIVRSSKLTGNIRQELPLEIMARTWWLTLFSPYAQEQWSQQL